MDKEAILNALGEVQYELAKVQRKLDILLSQSTRYKEVYREIENPVRAIQGLNEEIYETIEIEKWVLMIPVN